MSVCVAEFMYLCNLLKCIRFILLNAHKKAFNVQLHYVWTYGKSVYGLKSFLRAALKGSVCEHLSDC